MSFRNRLTLFFVLIVIVPMVSLTFVLFRVIEDNVQGKADAGVGARQRAAINLSKDAATRADDAAIQVGSDIALATALRSGDQAAAEQRASQLLTKLTLKRIVITAQTRDVVDVGARDAIFPARRQLVDRASGKALFDLEVAAEGPRRYARLVRRVTGLEVVVRRDGVPLYATLAGARTAKIPAQRAKVTIAGHDYRSAAFETRGFGGARTQITVLDSGAGARASVREQRLTVAGILLGFFVLALSFAYLVSKSLQRQIGEFLTAARSLGRGDFSARVPTTGRDEFAALGSEFNRMSAELEARLEELRAERSRLANAMRRIGETFASNLDRNALLEIVVRTAVDGVGAGGGRATVRAHPEAPLHQLSQAGSLDGLVPALHAAESAVLEAGAPREAKVGDVTALAHPLRTSQQGEDGGPPRIMGLVSVARAGRTFTASERELFHYLAGQASVSVENVGLHETVERQAVTDELTGLSNRRRFQEAMTAELERSRRFGQSLGLVMLDIDNFKKVNDTYGHQAGDLVLKEVARILLESSREIDEPARFGGEELAVVLPGTDLEGAFNLAERVRTGIEELELPVLTADGSPLKVTASFGTATAPESGEDARQLIEAADAALYAAKAAGKNRTVAAQDASPT